VSRSTRARLQDIVTACEAVERHLGRGPEGDPLGDELVFDAVRARLIEIGEAVKDVDEEILASEPDLPWRQVSGMRDWLAHRYFDTSPAILAATVDNDLPELRAAVQRILDRM
jgi:uncharacterized protein with HEPN domain